MTGKWFLNNQDLYATYGVMIAKGSYNEMMSPPKPRRRMEYEYTDENGLRVDTQSPLTYEPYRYKIKIVIVANSFTDFWTRYNAFFSALAVPGIFALKIADLGITVNLCYEEAKNVDKLVRLKSGKVASAYELSVLELNPKNRIYV